MVRCIKLLLGWRLAVQLGRMGMHPVRDYGGMTSGGRRQGGSNRPWRRWCVVGDESPVARIFRGRRRANSSQEQGPRRHRTVIRHTDDEWARVQALASLQGVSVPRLYERAVRSGDVVVAQKISGVMLTMVGVRRLLAGAVVNINQMAKVVNATGEFEPVAFDAAVEMVSRQIDRLNVLLEQLPDSERG